MYGSRVGDRGTGLSTALPSANILPDKSAAKDSRKCASVSRAKRSSRSGRCIRPIYPQIEPNLTKLIGKGYVCTGVEVRPESNPLNLGSVGLGGIMFGLR